MYLLITFSRPDFKGTVEGNGCLEPALAFFDPVKNYPHATYFGNGGATLTSSLLDFIHGD